MQIFCLDITTDGHVRKGQKTQNKLEFGRKNNENRQKAGLGPAYTKTM